jgi:hypothetical protein
MNEMLATTGGAEVVDGAFVRCGGGKTTLHPEIALRVIQELEEPAERKQPLMTKPLTARKLEVLQ